MPEEKTQIQERSRVEHVDIRPRDSIQRGNISMKNNKEKNGQSIQKPPVGIVGIAQKRRALQRSKRKARRGRLHIRKPIKKMVGVGFWMIVGVAVFKELMDPFITIMSFVDIAVVAGGATGEAWNSAVLGKLVIFGIKAASYVPVFAPFVLGASILFKIFWWSIGIMVTITASFAIWYYLAVANGVSFGMRKLSMFMVVFLVEAVPVLNLVPSTVLVLFIIRKMENNNQQSRFIRVAKKRYR